MRPIMEVLVHGAHCSAEAVSHNRVMTKVFRSSVEYDTATSHKASSEQKRKLDKIIDHCALQIYVCGSGKIATAVKATLVKIVQEHRNVDVATATATFNELIQGRFATDVFE